MTTGTAKGSCFCGAVQFTVDLPTLWCAHCHCSMCRRAHGAGFVTWVGVPRGSFHLVAGDEVLTRFQSSAQAVRSFCSRCGSTLLFESQRWPGEVHVVRANFDTPIDREPSANVYWSDRVEWARWETGGLAAVDLDHSSSAGS
jgi:hypothetical protein